MEKFNLFIKNSFSKISAALPANNNDKVNSFRKTAMENFAINGLIIGKLENRDNFAIEKEISDDYEFQLQPTPYQPLDSIFKCKIEGIASNTFAFFNGWYLHSGNPITVFPNGMIIGSLIAAIERYPDLVFSRLGQHRLAGNNSLTALNESFFTDGIFIYIPDNVIVEHPMQIVNLISSDKKLLVNNHNVIIVGKNSNFSLVYCNDSIHAENSFANNVTEIYIDENAVMNFCKMENKDAKSIMLEHVVVEQKGHSQFLSNAITFNAGYVRNQFHVTLAEPFAEARVNGLYLVDKKQVVDNNVFVNHAAPDCNSYQLYKGILDDEAIANFNGHILVSQDAQKTTAFQTNRNITLTDEAKITTKPFLEIYADDVQCSHGATVGQLNETEMFYLRSRGICERNARMLLMYAFAAEVTSFIDIINLRSRLNEMIQRRLKGELSLCDQCFLNCSDRKNFSFEIDISLL